MVKKRKAVSIILTRDPESNSVYMAERNQQLKFFGGYYAFPGGTLDTDDGEIEVRDADHLDQESVPYIIAAVREIFEETGVLLTHGESEIAQLQLQAYRKQLLAEEISFATILANEGHHVHAPDFNFVASILTPEFSPVRYDTQFYWVRIPPEVEPEIWPGELVQGAFYSAEEAVKAWETGDMLIVPPVIFMLREMVGRSIIETVPVIREYAEAYRRGKIHQVYFMPGVQLIALRTRTLLPATHTNTYLVGEKQLYIVDPAPAEAGEQERLWDYLDDRLNEGAEFAGILLTHHHSDHTGAIAECQKRYNLPLYAHKNTAYKLTHFKFAGMLEDGESLDLGEAPDGQGGWRLEVYHTPGHASGHLAFRESRYGTVLVGDLISTLSTIVISPPDGNLATYMQSLARLASIADSIIYPGHGPAALNGKKVVRYYIKHRQEREQKLIAALSSQPQTTHELVKKVYDDVEPMLWSLAEHSLHAGLEKLIEEGLCSQQDNAFVKTAGG